MQYIVCECFSMFGMAYEPAGTTPATPGALNFFDSGSASDIQIMALIKANLIKEDQTVDGIETEYKPPTCNLVKTVDGKAPNLDCNVELKLVERLEGKGVNNDNPRFPVLADYMQGLNDHEGNSVVNPDSCIGQLPDPRISTTTIEVTPGVNEVTTDDGNVSRFCTDPLKSLVEGPDGTWTATSQLGRTEQITTGNVTALGDGRVLIEFPNGSSQTVAALDTDQVLAELQAVPDSAPNDGVTTYHWEYVIRNLAGDEVNRIVGPTIPIPEILDKNGNKLTSAITILQPSDFVVAGRELSNTDKIFGINANGECVALDVPAIALVEDQAGNVYPVNPATGNQVIGEWSSPIIVDLSVATPDFPSSPTVAGTCSKVIDQNGNFIGTVDDAGFHPIAKYTFRCENEDGSFTSLTPDLNGLITIPYKTDGVTANAIDEDIGTLTGQIGDNFPFDLSANDTPCSAGVTAWVIDAGNSVNVNAITGFATNFGTGNVEPAAAGPVTIAYDLTCDGVVIDSAVHTMNFELASNAADAVDQNRGNQLNASLGDTFTFNLSDNDIDCSSGVTSFALRASDHVNVAAITGFDASTGAYTVEPAAFGPWEVAYDLLCDGAVTDSAVDQGNMIDPCPDQFATGLLDLESGDMEFQEITVDQLYRFSDPVTGVTVDLDFSTMSTTEAGVDQASTSTTLLTVRNNGAINNPGGPAAEYRITATTNFPAGGLPSIGGLTSTQDRVFPLFQDWDIALEDEQSNVTLVQSQTSPAFVNGTFDVLPAGGAPGTVGVTLLAQAGLPLGDGSVQIGDNVQPAVDGAVLAVDHQQYQGDALAFRVFYRHRIAAQARYDCNGNFLDCVDAVGRPVAQADAPAL